MKSIQISEDEARDICYSSQEYEEVAETERSSRGNGTRWLVVVKRVSDGALFAIQRESENEIESYGKELIPVECTEATVTHRVWHRPGSFKQPTSADVSGI